MKKTLGILLALAMLFFCTAFAESDWTSRDVTLTMIHEHTEETAQTVASSRMFRKVMAEFLEQYPNVHIEETALGSTETSEKLSVLAAADDLPDIVYLYNGLFKSIVGEGMLSDVTDVLDASTFRDGLTTFGYEGRAYGVPIKYSTYGYLYYNSEMWAEAGYETFPTTWDELLKAAETFAAKGIIPFVFANAADGTWACYLYLNPILHEICGDEWLNGIIAADGSASFTDACFIEALNKLESLKPLWNVDFNSENDQWAVAEYVKGNAAAHLSGTWVAGSIKSYEEEYPGIVAKTKVAMVPTFDGESASVGYAIPQGLGINAAIEGTDQYEAAKAFLQFMGSSRYSQYMANIGEMGPVKVEAEDTSSFLEMQVDIFSVLNSVDNIPELIPKLDATTCSAYKASVMSFLSGAVSAQQAAEDIQAVFEQK